MKPALLMVAVLLPVAARAQQGAVPPKPAPAKPTSVAEALSGTLNPRILRLSTATVLYRQLSDTATGRVAYRLRPGDFVVLPGRYSRWLAVQRTTGPSTLPGGVPTYYMPADALKDGQVTVVL
jgi:hypothetical protein